MRTVDPFIERVYLDGEALSFVRKLSTKFNLPRNNRTDYRIELPGVTGNAFGLHSMTLLASNIKTGAAAIQRDDPELRIDYAMTQAIEAGSD